MTLKELVRGNEYLYNRFMKVAKDFWKLNMYDRLDGAIFALIEMFRGDTTLDVDEVNRLAFEILEEVQK